MRMRTLVTSKGTTTIPADVRDKAGIHQGTKLDWAFRNGVIQARVCTDTLNAAQKHVLKMAGRWNGKISGAELLRRTRP